MKASRFGFASVVTTLLKHNAQVDLLTSVRDVLDQIVRTL